MALRVHSPSEFRRKGPKVHGRLYELFHDARFWAVVIVALVAVGTYLAVKFLASDLQSSFSYRPAFNP